MRMVSLLKNKIVLFAIVICVINSSCNTPQITKESPQINEVKIDSKFLIILPENHTRGESWKLKSEYNKSNIDNVSAVWHGNEKGIYFHFNTLHKGQDTLSFICRKYADTLNVKSFIIKIIGQ